MARHIMPIVQLGGVDLQLTGLDSNQDFRFVEGGTTELLNAGRIVPALRNALFLLPKTSFAWANEQLLKALPANLILYDEGIALSEATAALFALKGAHCVSFADHEHLSWIVKNGFYSGQEGFKGDQQQLRVLPAFAGTAEQLGHIQLRLKGEYGQTLKPVATWESEAYAMPGIQLSVQVETWTSPDVSVRCRLTFVNADTGAFMRRIEFDPRDLATGYHFNTDPQVACTYQVELLAQGEGTLDIGLVHFHRARDKFGELFPNARVLTNHGKLRDNIAYYFDAGDMKPPLAVNFSGWGLPDRFEGNFMMQSFGCPFMIFEDLRLSGGEFYIGSPELEAQVVDIIREKLKELGFGPHDLIISGISAGSTPCFYYGALLEPHAVIAGKPLINLGTIATNGRIKRTRDFQPSFDVLMALEGESSPEAAKRLNQRVWRRVKSGDFSHTAFAIAHMYQDDFDNTSFPQVFKWLTETYPKVQIMHKGMQGRHNDNTWGVVAWYTGAYRSILTTDYGRAYTAKGVLI